MKIYTLTFQFACNYGAVLQAYALKTYLEEQGHDVRVIDYWPHYSQRNNHWYSAIKESLTIKNFLLLPFEYFRERKFDLFKNKYLRLTRRCLNKEDINCLEKRDVVIVGSDQVWNSKLLEEINEVYFLNIDVADIRVSYAASGGQDSWDESMIREIAENAEKIDYVSVREQVFYDDLRKFTTKSIQVVPDPVFLLDKEQYGKILKPVNEKDYVLIYYTDGQGLTETLAHQLAEKYELKIYKIGSRKTSNGIIGTGDACVEEFLGWIENARFVVTCSFHGIAFSIILRKQFYAIQAGERSDRLCTMLKNCKLEKRFLKNERDLCSLTETIDYDDCEKAIYEYATMGKSFLNRCITGREYDKLL